jgi:hypothetical protein
VNELVRLSAGELLEGYRARAFSPVEALDEMVRRLLAGSEIPRTGTSG